MAILGKVAKFLVSPILGVASALGIGGSKKAVAQPITSSAVPLATRDDAAARARRDAEMRKRRGSASDILTGTGGAEAAAGVRLVAGS